MRKSIASVAMAAGLFGALLGPGPASAEFGLEAFDVRYVKADGSPATQAGSHPYAQLTTFKLNRVSGPPPLLDGKIKDLVVKQLSGFVGDGTMPRCSTADFLRPNPAFPTESNLNECPDGTAVGASLVRVFSETIFDSKTSPVYNLAPPPGKAARLGFRVRGVPAIADVVPAEEFPHDLVASALNISAAVPVPKVDFLLWGVPADPRHDFARGTCARTFDGDNDVALVNSSPAECPAGAEPRPFLTLPRSCDSSIETSYRASSWDAPDAFVTGGVVNDDHEYADDPLSPAEPLPFRGCSKLGFEARIAGATTTRAAQSPSGLEFDLDVDTGGLTEAILGELGEEDSPGEELPLANTEIKKAVVTLPEGMTANPSLAEGLEVCTEADLAKETAASPQGAGCPDGAKIGTVEVESPLIHEQVNGVVYIAEPYENPFGTLIALYIVIKNSDLGIIVKNRLKVEPDPRTGQLVTTVADIPQLPFSEFRMKLREGGRSPLISPRECGRHEIEAELTPWSGGGTITRTSRFEIISGPNEGPCPSGDLPFEPGFSAGTLNNNAGSHSPFAMRLTRRDGDQDLTRFDAILPEGALAKLAGVARCPEALIAAIDDKTGKEELASPSCPPNSKIGEVQGGAGVGSQLTYVPGSVYLAGPFGGAPLSVVGVVPAVAGPFDVGVVKTRQALQIHPVTGVASVDGALSDPIPHILAGIPLNVRDIQVNVNRPQFTINPTSCDPMATVAGIWGGGEHVFSTADDFPVIRNARFQAANCQTLDFKPRIRLQLFGGIKRGSYQGVRAVVRPRPGHANIAGSVVRFPRSAFIAQEHLKNICTRVQFAANACPPGSVYGNAVAWSPLLDFPLRGKVHLRSSNNVLPDLVADLRGPAHTPIKVEVSIRNDSAKGALRNTVQTVPDAPVSYFRLQVFGGDKGLIVNSRNICRGRNAARTVFRGHNGKRAVQNVPVRNARCKKRRKAKRRAAKRSALRGDQRAWLAAAGRPGAR